MSKGDGYVKISWIEFENTDTGLKIENIKFYKDITLLVGLSGAGKSQILNAVEYSLGLAVRKNIRLRPYAVSMGIQIGSDDYEWSYKIEKSNINEILFDNEENYSITYEKLLKNGKQVFERRVDEIVVDGYDKVPHPKSDESLLSQYSEDKEFDGLISELRKLYPVEMELAVRGGIRNV